MAKQTFIVDCETNGLIGYTKLHCIVFRSVDTNEVTTFRNVHTDAANCRTFIEDNVGHWVGHNFLGFDHGVLLHFIGINIPVSKVTDTLVLSRMLNYNQKGGHSLEEWGRHFNVPKSTHSEFAEWSEALEERCIQDTAINKKLFDKFRKYVDSPRYIDAIRLEHLTTELCNTICTNGYTFDLPKGILLYNLLLNTFNALRDNLREVFPKVSKPIREINPCLTSKGTLHSKDFRWMTGEKDYRPYSAGSKFTLFDFVEFNPGSAEQRIDRLNAAGWKPTNKTDGHKDAIREKDTEKLKHYSVYGWTTDEENLATVPDHDYLELWKDKWTITLPSNDENTKGLTGKPTETKSRSTSKDGTIKTPDLNLITNLGISTELILKILTECQVSKGDAARFVEQTRPWWSITATEQGKLEVCCVPDAMVSSGTLSVDNLLSTLGGKNYSETLQKLISLRQGAKQLARYLLLQSRLGSLKQWIGLCRATNEATGLDYLGDQIAQDQPVDPLRIDLKGILPRIHGTFTNPGAWTMRVSHQKPNMANIPAHLDRRGRVAYLGHEFRELWTVPQGYKLVGVDADSIQLRIFAHLCEDKRLIDSIEKGVKEEKTDIHHLNLAVMHPICKTREVAKTYIYALLLGAGLGKQAEILGCTKHEASVALKRMLEYYPGWKKLINGRLAREGQNGYIECLDGRYLLIPEPRQALAAHLQSGEKIIMAKAAQNWIHELDYICEDGSHFNTKYKLVNWVHDEFQTEALDQDGIPEFIAKSQVLGLEAAGRELKMNLKITGGKPKIGDNWAETH